MGNLKVFNLIFVLAVVVSFFFVLSSDVRAQSVCDGETGAAYGLCNAYCEAMDCDGDPEASQKACDKVEANYIKITGDTLPCVGPQMCASNADCDPTCEECRNSFCVQVSLCI